MDAPFSPPSAVVPETLPALADEMSAALTAWLEQLPPQARTAFLLREGFDADYAEIAQAIGCSESVCRALVERAAAQVRERPPISFNPPE